MMRQVEQGISDASSVQEKKALFREMSSLKKHYDKPTGLPSDEKNKSFIADKSTIDRMTGKIGKDTHPTRDSVNEKLPRGMDPKKW